MESWIDLFHSIRKVAAMGAPIFVTDNAVGRSEEENLGHLAANLAGEVDPARIVPFLTCKHSLEYCLLYAARAFDRGIGAVTVVGGDRNVGPPRCVPHGADLRRIFRERLPQLSLGGWANPRRDPAEQLDFLMEEGSEADFCLTQIVSEADLSVVAAFLEEADRRGVSLPVVFGVFFYHGPSPAVLERLDRFFPVPAERLTREFALGRSAEEICARTIRSLREVGAEKVYLANLGTKRVSDRYARILERVESKN